MGKLKIIPYNKNVLGKFEKERKKISKAIGDYEIYHIGSTAIPGLGGKGVIDIMIGIKNWKGAENIIEELKELGFTHIHPKEKGRIFLSKDPTFSQRNIHIHIIKKESKPYKEFLAFRDYLRKNKKEIEKFFKLKFKWLKVAKGDGKKYYKLKEKYVKEILKRKK